MHVIGREAWRHVSLLRWCWLAQSFLVWVTICCSPLRSSPRRERPLARQNHQSTRRSHQFSSQHIVDNPHHRLKSAPKHGNHLFVPSLIRHPCLNTPTSPHPRSTHSVIPSRQLRLRQVCPPRRGCTSPCPLEAHRHSLDAQTDDSLIASTCDCLKVQ